MKHHSLQKLTEIDAKIYPCVTTLVITLKSFCNNDKFIIIMTNSFSSRNLLANSIQKLM